MVIDLDVQAVLPSNLGSEALDVSILQDAIFRLESLQQQARLALFKKLACHAIQGHTTELDNALAELSEYAPPTDEPVLPEQPEKSLAQHAAAYRAILSQETQLEETTAVEQANAYVNTAVQELGYYAAQGSLYDAACRLLQLQTVLQERQAAAGSLSPGLVQATQEHTSLVQQCEQEVDMMIRQGLEQTFILQVDQGSGSGLINSRAVVSGCHNYVTSREIWAAEITLRPTGPQYQWLADQLVATVLPAVLASTSQWQAAATPDEDGNAYTCGMSWAYQQAAGDNDEQVEVASQHEPLSALKTLLELVGAYLFYSDTYLITALGSLLWQPLVDKLVQDYLQPTAEAAQGPGRSALLHSLVEQTTQLEAWAQQCGWAQGPYLQAAVTAAMSKLEARLQVAPLAAARTALLRDMQPTSTTCKVGQPLAVDSAAYQRLLSGSGPDWESCDPSCGLDTRSAAALSSRGQYIVGEGMLEVCGVAEQAIQEARASGSQAAASALIHVVAKIASLSRSLPQACPDSRHRLATVLPLALTHCNGLLHLADTILTCLAVHGPSLDQVVGPGETQCLLQAALALRQDAEQALQEQVASQVSMVMELAAQGYQGFKRLGSSASAQHSITYRKTTSQVLHTLGRLGKLICSHLAPQHTLLVSCTILDSLASHLCDCIMSQDDLGIDDCKELREVLGPIAVEALTALVPSQPSNDESVSGIPVNVLRAVVSSSCPSLSRLGLLLEMLDAKLKDVVGAWERRRMQACGMTADMAVRLICALFEHTEYRQDAIARVRATSASA